MMLVSELQILLSVFVLGVFTSPVLDASSSMLQGRTVKLSRRCLQQSPANASFIHLFNATFAVRITFFIC